MAAAAAVAAAEKQQTPKTKKLWNETSKSLKHILIHVDNDISQRTKAAFIPKKSIKLWANQIKTS